ncbi:coiled-coil domain-containing protein 113-like [Lytechinus variegatus]|uniref:coiled-coil domain-containing protein 113-like n=2 Tax=Lytechinus TaxID=7652 RepID=UPI001BB2B164|nr:coiled-coil domain-containing protein 113-like [Lytechinus variegatus]XP_041454296.1 coiled-coil domain-containing protein 113-like [Lytechinus variegatus]
MADNESVTTSSQDQQDDPLYNLSDDDLAQLLEDLQIGNKALQNETEMFDKYLKRVEPNMAAMATVAPTPSQSTHDTRVMRKRSKSKGSGIDKHLKLASEQKCDIAQREIEELREEIEKLKEESEKVLDNYKAVMEEADTRCAELKKSRYEFERDILKGSVNDRTKKVVAEKVIRYYEDKQRSRDALIEKLRLKNSTLKVQKKKLHLQLKQKEEMGEVLHEVDFQQLKIENSQYLEKIDERNQDLLRLKLMAGNTLQVLNSYKKKLQTLTMESDRLGNEIASRNELLSRIDAETETVEEERSSAEELNRRLRHQLEDYKVPEVVEYVQEKADLYELQKTVKSWERKVEIAEMALKTHRKTWQQMRMSSEHQQWGVIA